LTGAAAAVDHARVQHHRETVKTDVTADPKRRAHAEPAGGRHARLLALQRSAGNHAVEALIGCGSVLEIARAETITADQTHTFPYYPSADKTRVITLPDGAPKPNDTATVWNCPTSKIKYSQNSISWLFSSRTPGGAANLDAAVANLKSGSDTLAAMPPLRLIVTHGGGYVTLDNRRLWVAKQANKGAPRARWATADEYYNEYSKFTGGEFGTTSIEVRGRPGARR